MRDENDRGRVPLALGSLVFADQRLNLSNLLGNSSNKLQSYKLRYVCAMHVPNMSDVSDLDSAFRIYMHTL